MAREELVDVALEDGSVEPKPREHLRRRRLRVEVEIREASGSVARAARQRLRAPRVEAVSVHRWEAAVRLGRHGCADAGRRRRACCEIRGGARVGNGRETSAGGERERDPVREKKHFSSGPHLK